MGGSGYRPRVTGSIHVGGALGDSVLPHGVGRRVFVGVGKVRDSFRKASPPLRWECLASPSLMLWLPSCAISGKSFHLSVSVSSI